MMARIAEGLQRFKDAERVLREFDTERKKEILEERLQKEKARELEFEQWKHEKERKKDMRSTLRKHTTDKVGGGGAMAADANTIAGFAALRAQGALPNRDALTQTAPAIPMTVEKNVRKLAREATDKLMVQRQFVDS